MNQKQTSTDPNEVALHGTARSWFRRVRLRTWILLSVILLVVVSPLLYRQYRVSQVPLIPEPFDLKAFAEGYHIPDSENPYVEYRAAVSKLVEEQKWDDALYSENTTGFEWGKAPAEVKDAVQANEAALEMWMQGAEKPRAVYVPPDQLKIDTQLLVSQKFRAIARVSIWKQVQLQDERQLDDSWEIISAGQRTSVHLMQGTTIIERLGGVSVHGMFSPHLSRWSEDPDVSVEQLRSALANLREHQQLIPPVSDTIKSEYFVFRAPSPEHQNVMTFRPIVSTPRNLQTRIVDFVSGSLTNFGYRVIGEYEYSRRLLRHLFSNWIKFSDLPRQERNALELTTAPFLVFRIQDQPGGVLSAERLSELGQQSILVKSLIPVNDMFLAACDRDRFRWSAEELILALQIYYRLHGEFPKDLSLLVPEVLEKLPENPFGDDLDSTCCYRVESDHAVLWNSGEYEPVPVEEGPVHVVPPKSRSQPVVYYFTIYPPETRAPLYRPYSPELVEELKQREEAKKNQRPSGGGGFLIGR